MIIITPFFMGFHAYIYDAEYMSKYAYLIYLNQMKG